MDVQPTNPPTGWMDGHHLETVTSGKKYELAIKVVGSVFFRSISDSLWTTRTEHNPLSFVKNCKLMISENVSQF